MGNVANGLSEISCNDFNTLNCIKFGQQPNLQGLLGRQVGPGFSADPQKWPATAKPPFWTRRYRPS